MDHDESISVLTFGGGADHWRAILENVSPDVAVVSCQNRHGLADSYPGVNCLVGWRFPDQVLERLPDLQWIQNLSVGVDALVNNDRISPHVRITNTGGLYDDSMAEYVLWAMITLFRKFHTMLNNQRKRRWQQVFGANLAGRHVGIVGLGKLGSRVARMAAENGMQITAITRDGTTRKGSPDVDFCEPAARLPEIVAALDALVLCVPLTDATRGIIDASVVANMKPEAILINISRSALIDGSVVVDAVADGRLAGAVLDVFDKEPLPRWSRLWKIPNLIVTPHLSGLSSDYKTRVAELLTENMLRFKAGKPLLNEISRAKGY